MVMHRSPGQGCSSSSSTGPPSYIAHAEPRTTKASGDGSAAACQPRLPRGGGGGGAPRHAMRRGAHAEAAPPQPTAPLMTWRARNGPRGHRRAPRSRPALRRRSEDAACSAVVAPRLPRRCAAAAPPAAPPRRAPAAACARARDCRATHRATRLLAQRGGLPYRHYTIAAAAESRARAFCFPRLRAAAPWRALRWRFRA
jgi:hypothetical protein